MADDDLFTHVQITPEGAISLGGMLVCDGYEKGHHAAAFTHIHRDHIGDNFGTCMHNYPVYISKITMELLEAITNDSYSYRTQLHIIDYGSPQPIRQGNHVSYLTLLESSHTLGASQILLHTNGNVRMLYSGDISPIDRPPKCDILVVDSTHGSLHFNKRIEHGSLERRLTEAVLSSIVDKKKPVCVHAHRGKLQHLMSMLSCHKDMPEEVQFLSGQTDMLVANVYRKHGAQIKDLVALDSYEGDEVVCGEYPWIEFRSTMGDTVREKSQSMSSIRVSGRLGADIIRQNGEDLWTASDEHAELDGILRYVRDADPDAVVTDNSSRTRNGETLAGIIVSRLGIPSRPMP